MMGMEIPSPLRILSRKISSRDKPSTHVQTDTEFEPVSLYTRV